MAKILYLGYIPDEEKHRRKLGGLRRYTQARSRAASRATSRSSAWTACRKAATTPPRRPSPRSSWTSRGPASPAPASTSSAASARPPDIRSSTKSFTAVEKDARLFGVYVGSGQNAAYYVNGSGGLSFHVGQGWVGGTYLVMPDSDRHTVVFDAPNTTMTMTPGATDGSTYSSSSVSASGGTSANTLVFGSLAVPDVNNGYMYAKARLYRLTIDDGSAKVREYVPVVENGVAGLRDLVNPESAPLTANGLSVSGRGHEGAEEWIATPAAKTTLGIDATKTFTARAVGARRYVWTRNGDTLAVEWTRGGYASADAYTVTPVYDVFGEEMPGTPLPFSVARVAPGLLFTIR